MIAVRGDDAEAFLQGQLSNDITAAASDNPLLAAWCNPKGRVICLLQVLAIEGGFGLVLPSEMSASILQRLTMFRFRSKVELNLEPVPPAAGIENTSSGLNAWLQQQIHLGMPEIWLAQSEKFTPHMLNLDLLNAISFDKGCYTGQEIVARTHYRGASKRRSYRFRSSTAVNPGDKVSDGQRDIGEVINAIGKDMLAVVPTDKLSSDLSVNGASLEYVALANL